MIAGRNTQPFVLSFRGESLHLDRSLALALVAIGHLALALWMLLPASMAPDPQAPQAPVVPEPRIPAVFIEAKVTPLPPPPALTVPERQTPVKALPVVQPRIVEAPSTAAWVEPMPAVPTSTEFVGDEAPAAPPADSGVPLAYESASPPRYPRDAARLGQEGTVLLRVQVDASGKVLRVEIAQGSGVRALDDAAQRHVQRNWRFHPAMHQGRAVAAWAEVPIRFSLQ